MQVDFRVLFPHEAAEDAHRSSPFATRAIALKPTQACLRTSDLHRPLAQSRDR
jgi:hypothetical protein